MAILVENNEIFCQILLYEIDFHVHEKAKNTIGNNGGEISEGGYPGKKTARNYQFSPFLAIFGMFSLKWLFNLP